jgi:TolB-like protein/Tfp pilus assembly protein PilF
MSDTTVSLPVYSGGFELDTRAGELRKEGLTISLPGQLLQLLTLLMERPGQVVTREEIRSTLWSDSFVNFDDSINSAIKRLRQSLDDSAENPRFIETLPGHGYRFAVPVEHTATIPAADAGARDVAELRVAVLPFENLSGNPADEYLVDGLTDALITALAKGSALHVKPRSSVMAYKGARKSLRAMGRKLKVDVELQGTLVHSGNRVRVATQLLNVATEEHLWAESYDCEFHDTLKFQTGVAVAIAEQVKHILTPNYPRILPSSHPRRPAAYEAYIKAHHVFKSFTDVGLWKARQYWNKAVQEDPEYAKAYAGLAESYNMLGILGLTPAPEALAQAREAATRALEIDDSLSEAHTGLACTFMLEWDWASAEKEFNRAIQLDTNLTASNPCHYAEFLMAVGQSEKAIVEVERLQESQPLSVILSSVLGWIYYGNRSYDRAVRQHQKVVAIDPQFSLGHMCLGMDYSQKRRHAAAIAECRKARSLGGSRLVLSALGCAYAMAGDKNGARQILKELKVLGRTSYVPPYVFATIYAALGEKDAAFDWLGRSYEVHDPGLIGLNWDPQLDNLRLDLRFHNLLDGIGMKPSLQSIRPGAYSSSILLSLSQKASRERLA